MKVCQPVNSEGVVGDAAAIVEHKQNNLTEDDTGRNDEALTLAVTEDEGTSGANEALTLLAGTAEAGVDAKGAVGAGSAGYTHTDFVPGKATYRLKTCECFWTEDEHVIDDTEEHVSSIY